MMTPPQNLSYGWIYSLAIYVHFNSIVVMIRQWMEL